MKLRLFFYALGAISTLLMASCATQEYWIPPHEAPQHPPKLAIFYDNSLGVFAKEHELSDDFGLPAPEIVEDQYKEDLTEEPADKVNGDVGDKSQDINDEPAMIKPTVTENPEIVIAESAPIFYYAQAADTLPVIATRFGVDPSEIESQEPIPDTAYLTPGQLLLIPRRLVETTSPQHTMPDSEVVFSPSAADFDVDAFVMQAGGKLSTYSQWLKTTGTTSGVEVIKRVAIENSINPRLLLSLLEYQSGWVYGQPKDEDALLYPMGYRKRHEDGLYRQLVWAVNQLSTGYYAYREGRMTEITFPDGTKMRLAPDLNAGSAALQYYFAQQYNQEQWEKAIDSQIGFPALHTQMFGDPWERAKIVEPLFPRGLAQPPLSLPFERGHTWAFTGGPHGAWERDGAYAALDFAPGSMESGCVKSNEWVTASAAGLVTRSENGVVALDLDGDGREQTGWVIIYLHIEERDRVPVGAWVDADDKLGHPSCEGGISTGTHVHMARKFNGEWIPADGPLPFNLDGWIAHAGSAPYKGTLTRDGQTVIACSCANGASFITRDEDK